jgi:hypothetical protein
LIRDSESRPGHLALTVHSIVYALSVIGAKLIAQGVVTVKGTGLRNGISSDHKQVGSDFVSHQERGAQHLILAYTRCCLGAESIPESAEKWTRSLPQKCMHHYTKEDKLINRTSNWQRLLWRCLQYKHAHNIEWRQESHECIIIPMYSQLLHMHMYE